MTDKSMANGRPPLSLPHEVAFVAVISAAQFLTQSGLGQAIAPLHIIGDSFDTTNPGILSWFAAGYSLTVGSFILISGRAGDLFGHKRMFLGGFIWFGIWSLIAGLTRYTHSYVFFIVARVMQGIGPAIVLPNGLAILGKTYPASERKNLVFAIFGSTAPTGYNVGAVFASLLAQEANWSWAFYIMAIVCCLVALSAFFVIPPDTLHDDEKTRRTVTNVLQELDLFAAVIGIGGLVLFNIAWNQAPVVGWQEAYIIVLLIVSIALMLIFAYLQARVSRYPLVPKEIFTREISLILGCISTGWASFGIWVYYGWLFLELLRRETPLLVSAQFVPTTFAGLMAGVVVALFLTRVGPGWIMCGAMTAFMLGNLFFSIMPVEQTYWALTFVALCITPFGMDMSFPAANVIISDFVPQDKQGNAASLANTILNYSISIGLGIAGTVEVQLNNGGATDADLLEGYRAAWRVGIGLAALGMMLAVILTILITRRKSRDHLKHENSKQGSAENITDSSLT